MPQLFYEDGSAIPDAAIPEAVARGQAFAKPGAPIAVRDTTTGQIGRIDPADLGNPNYQPLTDAEIDAERIHRERGTIGQQAITGAEGLARGATLGLSDLALTGALGNEYGKGALERREENSKTAGVSELAGAVLPLLATEGGSAAAEGAEGASLLSRGAGTVARTVGAPIRALSSAGGAIERGVAGGLAPVLGTESLLGRAATKAISMGVSGAAEGGVFGAGQTLSDSALKGDPLTTEALMAGMGHGALFGGALGATAGVAGEVLPSLVGNLLPSKQKLENAATGFARKQLGRDFEKVGKDMPREVAEGWKNASAKDLLEYKLQTGPNAGKTIFEASTKPQDIADNLNLMRQEKGAALGEVRERAATIMDANPAVAPDVDSLLQQGDDLVKSLRRKNTAGANSAARAAEHDLKLLRKQIAEASDEAIAAIPPRPAVGADEAASFLRKQPEFDALDGFLGGDHRKASSYWNDGGYEGVAKRIGKEAAGKQKKFFDDVNSIITRADDAGVTAPGTVYSGRKWTQKKIDEFLKDPKNGIWSTSTAEKQALEFATDNVQGELRPVLLEIEQHSGVPVSGLQARGTMLGNEEEVLLGSDRKWKVLGHDVVQTSDGPITKIRIQELGAPAPPVPPAVPYRAVTEWQRNLEADLNPKDIPKAMRGLLVKNAAARQDVSNIVNNWLKGATASALTAAGEDGSIVARLHQEYAGVKSMQKAAEKEAGRVASNRRVSLTDHMLGIGAALTAMASGNMGALTTMGLGGAAAIGNKIAREQGNAIMAQIALRASKMNTLVDSAAHALSGTGEKLIAPVKLALEAEKPAPYNPRSQTELKAQFAEVRDRLQELQSPQHQQAQLAHATGRLQTAYPEVANALNLHLLKTQSYLNDQLPKPRGGSPISPLARPPTVPPREMQKFLSKVNAVMAPEAVIADIAKGKLDDDAIGTLQAVYPETFGALRAATIKYTAANKEEMPYPRVVHISRLFSFAGDSSMGPRFADIQAAIQDAEKPLENNTQQGQAAMPRLKGPPLKPSEDMTLPSAHAPGSR